MSFVPNSINASSWTPLLEGTDAERATAAIDEIAHGIAKFEISDGSLANGSAGVSLFFSYRSFVTGADADVEAAVGYLNHAIDEVESTVMSESLIDGFTGIAWTVEHLKKRLLEDDIGDDDANAAIDDALNIILEVTPWRGNYDLTAGLVGLGVYSIECLPRELPTACLIQIIDQLHDLSENTDDGITWHTSPELLPPWQREIAPNGYYNLGLAHGVPGVVAFLGLAADSGIYPEKVRPMLDGAVQWLLANRLPKGSPTNYGAWILAHEDIPEPSRSAWCYGDPGVACALLIAGRATANNEWLETSRQIAHAAATRPLVETGVTDFGLCHGSAGLGHIMNRFYHATCDSEFADAARYWYRHLLDNRRADGIAGFPSFTTGIWETSPAMLTAAAGVGLSLLAATSNQPPDWDRCMLIS